MPPILRWERCDRHLPWIRAGRHALPPGQEVAGHAHAFAEAVWVHAGSVAHLAEGRSETLVAGDARFLAPGAAHALRGGRHGAITTVSFSPGLFQALARRHRAASWWPWPVRGFAARRFAPAALVRIEAAIDELPGSGQEPIDGEWFAAVLCRQLRGTPTGPPMRRSCPSWLEDAIASLAGEQDLSTGPALLAARCGRSQAHVARALRLHHGCTATGLLNRLRLERAARALRLGHAGIAAVALDAGFGNLGHFHRRFKAAYGCTPAAYRRSGLA